MRNFKHMHAYNTWHILHNFWYKVLHRSFSYEYQRNACIWKHTCTL